MSSGDHLVEPLYTVEDAEATFPLFHPVPLHTPTAVGPGHSVPIVRGRAYPGIHLHAAGSRIRRRKTRLGFTGDLGRAGLPIIRDPEPLPAADYLIMESTYGDRVHEPIQSVAEDAGRHREPDLPARRKNDRAGLRGGQNAAAGAAAASTDQRRPDPQLSDLRR